MYKEKYRFLNVITRWRSCSGVPRGCSNRIRLWPLRPEDHSFVLIGAGGERHFDGPAHVLANNVSTRIDLLPTREDRSIVHVYTLVAANCYKLLTTWGGAFDEEVYF